MTDRVRCSWCGTDPLYVAYHDAEWGVPLHDERLLFEHLCLEGFQAGLSWLTILRKRAAFRSAFADFVPEQVAGYGEADVERLLADAGIIRNRAKILAAIDNARTLLDLHESGTTLDDLLWSFAPPPRTAPLPHVDAIPAVTPESEALSKELRRRGFRFVGPTTVYALMQSAGLVNDHVAECWRWNET